MQTNNANYKCKKDIISMLKLKAFVHIKTQEKCSMFKCSKCWLHTKHKVYLPSKIPVHNTTKKNNALNYCKSSIIKIC